MRSPVPDRSSRAGLDRRAALAWLAALASLICLAAALAAQNAGGRVPPAKAAFARDTTPPGDLRCLTRRPEDCLTEPVPRDEPHGAVCATCHSLWERGTSAGTLRSCTDADCHASPRSLTPFHRTVSAAALEDCTACHTAHAFRVAERGAACVNCHESGGRPAVQARAAPTGHLPQGLVFAHDTHAGLACTSCHAARDRHGIVKVARIRDCRTCHHESPADNDCVRCHTRGELDARTFTVTRPLAIRVGSLDRPIRSLVFDHARHATAECRTCHTGADLEAPASTDCSSCHFEHHAASSNCAACHEKPAEGAHDRNSHLGCGGAGCHVALPAGIEAAPRTRQLCLACHTSRADHKPDRACADCHALPRPPAAAMD